MPGQKSLIRNSVAKMSGYVPGEQSRSDKIIKLNTNENPYPPSPRVVEALLSLDVGKLRLYPDPVSLELRKELAGRHGCKPENVFVCNGSDETLKLCTQAFVENGGSIGYFNPSYSLYPVLADIREAVKRPIELSDEFEWPTDAMADMDFDLFFLSNPNAPTSILYPSDAVRDFCVSGKGVVVIDEAYVDFASHDCMNLALTMDNVLVARTLSKSFSLAGLRVGYAIGPEPLINALMKLKDSYNVDAISQQVALAAVKDSEYMRTNVARICKTRSRLTMLLKDKGYKVYPSEANFIWTKPAGIQAEKLFGILRKKGILVRYFPGDRTGAYIRITIGTDTEIDRLLDTLSKIVDGTFADNDNLNEGKP
ncbi:MAG: histidinol-phosphate transaminase [Lentisphaerae bacterium]|nr:histidinol-phosphate transaminase [Lentisphaerota bacterium]